MTFSSNRTTDVLQPDQSVVDCLGDLVSSGSKVFRFKLQNHPVVPKSVRLVIDRTSEVVTDDGGGGLYDRFGRVGFIDYRYGRIGIESHLALVHESIRVDYRYDV